MNSLSVSGKNWVLRKYSEENSNFFKDNFSLDEITSLFVKAANVALPTNFSADLLIMTVTFASCFFNIRINSHVLYAAIEPVIQINIFLFFKGSIF